MSVTSITSVLTDPGFRLPLGDWVDAGVDGLIATFGGLFDLIRTVLIGGFEAVETVLITPPMWIVALVLAGLAYLAKGWRLALGALIGFLVVQGVDQWGNAMASLALVLVASAIALAIGIPMGIWAASSDRVSAAVRPVLDFMQTMPAFVYLIPVVIIFSVGPVPGLVATIVFALAPGVRFTELGIRQVDQEVVEAGHAFGSTPRRILRQIQLPLALPTIMAGVNQVIMLSLSMVVISGLVGAAGLGRDVVSALSRVNVSLGFEAGLAVVILAMYLDRITSALADRSPVAKALRTTSA
ncbi:proline/glycine betaine ABC transporter permease [Actinotalea sp. K2]|uniref:ABC transporter permease n=1 Tax=Actinotalea sp. K2 TaxID=2939438 RepID=UPI0020182855|nr:proline/glycine betaine ABC transporter permease [Actinotalea sp. K2]MCL3862681.1 proline/glycine betaine ABC transporter permease [Actinotalea sp. K2]